jgi:hypothetical protein
MASCVAISSSIGTVSRLSLIDHPMSLARFVKIVLSTLSIILFLCLVGLFLFSPGARDFSKPIINGYMYDYVSSNGKFISYEGKESFNGIILDGRVDEYRVDGDKILVARSPQMKRTVNGSTEYTISYDCEYWVIETKKHTVAKTSDTGGLHCRSGHKPIQ